ncbi:MAG: DUF2516 family protein [Mycobacteriaceae bacterium]
MSLEGLAGVVLQFVSWAASAATIYAFVNAAMQRSDAYPAADKLTKPAWLAILGIAGLLSLVLSGGTGMVIAAVAAGVYLADVRPKLLEVQGKSR